MPKYQIEMLWDCSSCGKTAIGGLQDHCPGCGAAHDIKKDPWYMPGDTSHRARITDAGKLAKAHAGPNWTCEHCGGTQRAPDGACLNCAGPRSEAHADRASGRSVEAIVPPTHPQPSLQSRPAPPRPPLPPAREVDVDWPPRRSRNGIKLAVGIAAAVLLVVGLLWLLFHQRLVDIEVVDVEWTHTVSVERYKQVAENGWDENIPADAANVVNQGQEIHHYDQVLDHYETIHFTEQVYDGEDCVDIPQTCYTTPVTCSPNDNGTATCTGGDERCSGGGRSCTSRYRTESRTRQEPRYRDEPRYEDHFAWTVWRWKPQRTPSHSGTTTTTTWPDASELCLDCEVGPGEKEREAGRRGRYEVRLRDERGKSFDYAPQSEAEFHRFPSGSRHQALYSIARGLEFDLASD